MDKVTVRGQKEVQRGLERVEDAAEDMTKANAAIGDKVLIDVKENTRRKSGDLAAGWGADPKATEVRFVNPVHYSIVQEFGSKVRNIEPTLAVPRAFEANQDAVIREYSDHIRDAAKRAGFRTKH